MYSRAMLAILLLGLFTLAPSAQLAPFQAADGFCSVEGWSILNPIVWHEGQAFVPLVKIGNWTIRLADVAVTGSNSSCPNAHPAILDVFDESDQTLGQYSACPGLDFAVRRQTDGQTIAIRVNQTAVGMTLSAKWITIWGRARNCSDEYLDANFSTPVGTASQAIPPFATGGGSNPAVVGNGSQADNVVIVTPPLPAPPQVPPVTPEGQPPAPAEQPAVTTESTPPAPPQPPVSSPPQPAPSPSSASRTAYTNDKSGGEFASFPPPAQSTPPSSAGWPWWMAPVMVAVLGAFFMGVMAFYYRSPSVLGPFQTPGAPAPEAEAFPPVYLSTTRIALMEQMADTERIPTDIALRLKKSKSTVVEQLEDLCASGLVERIQTPGRKFVFYRLSRSGRHALVHSPDAKKKPSLLPF